MQTSSEETVMDNADIDTDTLEQIMEEADFLAVQTCKVYGSLESMYDVPFEPEIVEDVLDRIVTLRLTLHRIYDLVTEHHSFLTSSGELGDKGGGGQASRPKGVTEPPILRSNLTDIDSIPF